MPGVSRSASSAAYATVSRMNPTLLRCAGVLTGMLLATSSCREERSSPPQQSRAAPSPVSTTPSTGPAGSTVSEAATATPKPSASADEPTIVQLGARGSRSFVVRADGRVLVWGDPGPLGLSKLSKNQPTPAAIEELTNVKRIALGDDHACSMKADGSLECWGRNFAGSVGDGTIEPRAKPTATVGLSRVKDVVAGESQTLALTEDGKVYFWGNNHRGRWNAWGPVVRKPALLDKLASVTALALGNRTACVIHHDGALDYFGRMFGVTCQDFHELGCDTQAIAQIPNLGGVRKAAISENFAEHACFAHTDGSVSCIGEGDAGQLGDGRSGPDYRQPKPIKVDGLSDIVDIAVGKAFSCAARKDGKVFCWGDNVWGQLGTGDKKRRPSPVEVVGLTDVTAVALGSEHACALRLDQSVMCWGKSQSGQVGDGTSGIGKAVLTATRAKL